MSSKPLGAHGIALLRVLSTGPAKRSDVVKRLGGSVATATAEAMIDGLIERGLLTMKWSRLQLTRAGRQALPTEAPPSPMRPYEPPRVVRRRGSDVAGRLPSVAAGRQYMPRGK